MMRRCFFVPMIFAVLSACTGLAVKDVEQLDSRRIEISFAFNTESYPWLLGTSYPQLAVWVKAGDDAPQTVFVTQAAGKNRWMFARERPESLPVWFGIRSQEKGVDVDAVTGATPSGETHTLTWEIPARYFQKTLTVYLEANVSFDYNGYYSKNEGDPGYSGANGQPSVVWAASFDADDQPKDLTPEIVGHGDVLGKDHAVDGDISRLTTAADLFHYIRVEYDPGK